MHRQALEEEELALRREMSQTKDDDKSMALLSNHERSSASGSESGQS